MNRIYKVIYSKAHQCYIVVSELAKRNHKSSQPSIDHSTPALARIIALAQLMPDVGKHARHQLGRG